MKSVFLAICTALFVLSCKMTDKNVEPVVGFAKGYINNDSVCVIDVVVSDSVFKHLGQVLCTSNYIQLASEPLLASIEKIQILNDRIYLFDASSRLVCYDLDGRVIFVIDAVGNGPGEYTRISNFMLNQDTHEVIVHDKYLATFLYYDMRNGKYLRSIRMQKPTPTDCTYFDGIYFYDNKRHSNYEEEKLLHYSLLTSKDGKRICQHYFPHDEAETAYDFGTPFKFYSNGEKQYYCRDYDNMVYQLQSDSLIARYQINLPDFLPLRKIAKKISPKKLIASGYSFFISDIFECEGLLFFRYFKDKYSMVALYDTSAKRLIYSGKRMEDDPDSCIPLFNSIDGVYENEFWGVLTPEFIEYYKEKNPHKYPDFKNYNAANDNPVIAFYKLNLIDSY